MLARLTTRIMTTNILAGLVGSAGLDINQFGMSPASLRVNLGRRPHDFVQFLVTAKLGAETVKIGARLLSPTLARRATVIVRDAGLRPSADIDGSSMRTEHRHGVPIVAIAIIQV